MQALYELTPPSPAIRQTIAALCKCDPDFRRIEAEAGPVTVLQLAPTFAAMVRIIVAQHLATRAAKAIFLRLADAVTLEPEPFLQASDAVLKSAGLSNAKIKACRGVAHAIADGQLDLAACADCDDATVLATLTALPGVGPWTAEIFMLFALNRPDIFPATDLAIHRAYIQLKQRDDLPTAKHLLAAVEAIRPYRSAAAHLLWHYYRYATGLANSIEPPP